jgi:hypothetical protein
MKMISRIASGHDAATSSLSKPLLLLILALMLVAPPLQAATEPPPVSAEIEKVLDQLLAIFGTDGGLQPIDSGAMDAMAAFVHKTPQTGLQAVQDRREIRGSGIIYELRRPLDDVVRYVYNHRIPEGAINPSSVNYSFWKEVAGNGKALPDMWNGLDSTSTPQVTRGVVREFISPDLHTGAHYQYDLRRAFVVQRRGTSRIVLSMSLQIGPSEVGRKGFIVGDDQDWNYLYTQEVGLNKAGLGWVKSKIYNFFSVCCYVEDDARPGIVRVGAFQWLGAGWAGLNVVDTHHIRRGLQRYADQFKAMMESGRMPDPADLERVCAALEKTDEALLRQKALDVTQFVLQKARQDEALGKKKLIQSLDANAYVALMDKHQLVSSLMREYVKYCLGKQTPLSPTFWVALQQSGPKRPPLS